MPVCATAFHLLDYGRKAGLDPSSTQAHIIFYYGLLSLPRPLAVAGKDLDEHFDFPVIEAIEQTGCGPFFSPLRN